MKIIVCMKQVPASTKVDIDPETGAMKRLTGATRTNPYDLFALETALQLRELVGGTVTALTMGPPQAEVMMRDAYTMGADEAVILSDRKFSGADVLATSYTLSQGIQVLGGADLIIVRDLMRHASVDTTLDCYINVKDQEKERTLRQFGAKMGVLLNMNKCIT